MTVHLTGRLICRTEAEDQTVRTYLPAHITATRQEAGCLRFVVEESAAPMIWTVDELFVDRAAFDAHQSRMAASEWGLMSAGIHRDYTITETEK